jgi:hypothetical protein
VNEAKRPISRPPSPTPSELIDLSRGMEILVGATDQEQDQNLASGEKQLVFETEHKTARTAAP